MSKLSGFEVFGSATRTKILILVRLLKTTYATELARLLGLSQPSVAQSVRSLESQGLVAISGFGNQRMVSLSPRFFAATELAALLDKLAEADPDLLGAVAQLRRRPRQTGKKL